MVFKEAEKKFAIGDDEGLTMLETIITSEVADTTCRARVETYELIDDQTVRRFRASLEQLLSDGATDVRLDMSQVRMVSSMAICAVIAIDGRLRKRGGRLRLRQVHAGSLEVFAYMRLHELLDIEAASPELAA